MIFALSLLIQGLIPIPGGYAHAGQQDPGGSQVGQEMTDPASWFFTSRLWWDRD
jgi:hypothetical protein